MDALKRLVSRHGWEIAACVCRVNGQTALLEELQGSGQCVTRGQLAVNGKDFPWVSGPAVGQLLNWLLEYVLEHPEANTRTQLLQLAERWRFRR